MKFITISAAIACALSTSAQAGVFTDDLSRCLVNKSSASDRDAFMGWMFSAVSADPALQEYTTLDRGKRDEIAKKAADVFQRLLLIDCRKEATGALKAEGESAMMESFGVLGQSAAHQMFQSPAAQTELESLARNFDDAKLKALAAEAGLADKSEKEGVTP